MHVDLYPICQDLQPLFEKYGDVGDVYIPLERGSGRSRGFAFVRYYDKRDAEVSVNQKVESYGLVCILV